jgi:hypothetical protein
MLIFANRGSGDGKGIVCHVHYRFDCARDKIHRLYATEKTILNGIVQTL